MKAYLFPGQGSQFSGMGEELHKINEGSKLFEIANKILGFDISKIMFNGSKEDLKQTNVTQPAIFIHSVILSKLLGDSFNPEMVAGHSLGEFSALAATGSISFEDGLSLVRIRAEAMRNACDLESGTMAAVLGMDDKLVEEICFNTAGIVVAANYNCPGQLVISGEIKAIEKACESLKTQGAKRAIILPVGGAFHSPLMEPARDQLAQAIDSISLNAPSCPIYQNVSSTPTKDPQIIKTNLISQLTAPVKWTSIIKKMNIDGAKIFTEVGPGSVLQGLCKKIESNCETQSASII
jgi:[acyl-carrier-protein] S-malonyltransferase|tara:strand:+ start:1414 stop:2295 length:882 start_codon:yes stop_codon:yes gene_type:complete